MQGVFYDDGDEHIERRAPRPPHARETGGERIYPRERGGGDRREAQKAYERRPIRFIERGIEEAGDGAREGKEPHGAGHGDEEGQGKGVHGAPSPLPRFATRNAV